MAAERGKSQPYLLTDDGGVAVFRATAASPKRRVRLEGGISGKRGLVPIPFPDWVLPDAGTDGHTVILSPDGALAFEFWNLHVLDGVFRAGQVAIVDMAGEGFHPGLSARASGFSLMAGLVWPGEYRLGSIRHALVFVWPRTRKGKPVFPATYSDGGGEHPATLAMGTRIRLDPAFDLDSFGLDDGRKAIFRALQVYGAWLGDTGSFAFKGLSPRSSRDNPWEGQPGYSAENGSIDLSALPVDRLQVMTVGAAGTNRVVVTFPDYYED
ncbi:MAG: hypothetical protein J0L75_21460 [Spirochaetes bacterium]|nr:hypothetical protein [Spirochaetota bacterium]